MEFNEMGTYAFIAFWNDNTFHVINIASASIIMAQRHGDDFEEFRGFELTWKGNILYVVQHTVGWYLSLYTVDVTVTAQLTSTLRTYY